jgi:putative oxidoreductase
MALIHRARVRMARADHLLGRFPMSVTQLVLRVTLALPFWRSGQTKWAGWFELSDSAVYLFEEEFRIHLLGHEYAYPLPQITALASAVAETILPIMLVLGLATRFAALAVLAMTALIQLTVPDGWETYHLPWAAMGLAVMTYGPGKLALDHFLNRGSQISD